MSTSGEVTVRSARMQDHRDVCRLMDLGDEFHRELAPWMFQIPTAQPRPEAYFADLLKRQDAAVLVADAGPIVGVAFALIRAAPELPIFIPQRWGLLDGLVVDPGWRRRGIGKLLVQAVEAWSAGLGAPWVELNVYDVNAGALRFYQELGYLPMMMKLRKPA
jgi:GNAT superfamily N-acetyltransferase